jgi:hypothetical protein
MAILRSSANDAMYPGAGPAQGWDSVIVEVVEDRQQDSRPMTKPKADDEFLPVASVRSCGSVASWDSDTGR